MLPSGVLCALALFAQLPPNARELRPGGTLQSEVTSHGSQAYRLSLHEGQVADIEVEQFGTDLAVTVFNPEGRQIALVDARESGPEPVFIAAASSGVYRFEIKVVDDLAFSQFYRIHYRQTRSRIPDDDDRLLAQQITSEAKKLSSQSQPEFPTALAQFQHALEIWRRLGDRASEAAVLSHIGTVYHMTQNYSQALAFHLQARTAAKSAGAAWTEGESSNNAGLDAWRLGDFTNAIEYLGQCLTVWTELGHRYGQAAALSNLGILYRETGEYQKARSAYTKALPILSALGDTAHKAFVYSNLGVVMHSMGEDRRALQALNDARELFHAAGNRSGESRAYLHEARIRLAALQLTKADWCIQQASPLAEQTQDRRALAEVASVGGQIAAAQGRNDDAKQSYQVAIQRFRQIKDQAGESGAIHNLGVLYAHEGDAERARSLLDKALLLRRNIGIQEAEAETLYQTAELEYSAGELDSALDHVRTALSRVDTLRSRIAGPEARMSYLASKKSYYALAVDIFAQMSRQGARDQIAAIALETAEHYRARALLDLLGEASLPGLSLSPEILQRERNLRKELSFWSAQLSNSPNVRDNPAAIRQKVESVIDRYHDLESEMRTASPGFASLTAVPLTSAKIKDLLDSRTILLEYSLGKRTGFVCAVTRDDVTIFELPPLRLLKHAVQEYQHQVLSPSEPGRTPASPRELGQAAKQLSRMLLTPIAKLLGSRRIVVSTENFLQQIPFAALPAPGTGKPLMVDHEIIFIPSASVYAAHRRQLAARPKASKLLAVMADPVFDGGDARVRPAVRVASPRFARLPFSRTEAETILSMAPASEAWSALGFDASADTVRSGALRRYRIVHMATHSTPNAKHPELSALVFSLVDKIGSPQNGYLRLPDITALHLTADLVTLSACRTAVGKEVAGEGMVGLATSFLYAGAGKVMVSLWNVEDEATSEWMRVFYSGLLGPRRLRAAQAMREAQLYMWNQRRWHSPYYWAAWTLVGDWE